MNSLESLQQRKEDLKLSIKSRKQELNLATIRLDQELKSLVEVDFSIEELYSQELRTKLERDQFNKNFALEFHKLIPIKDLTNLADYLDLFSRASIPNDRSSNDTFEEYDNMRKQLFASIEIIIKDN